MAVSQHIIAWLCDETRVVPEFLLFAIYGMTGELLRLTNGSTIGTIGLADVKGIHIAQPPVDEQRAIVAHVFSQKAAINEIADKVQTSISRLQEHRATLIMAGVTGQIAGLQ
jgi:type I restriction enzyme S subunit